MATVEFVCTGSLNVELADFLQQVLGSGKTPLGYCQMGEMFVVQEDDARACSHQPSRRVWLMSLAALGLGSVFGRRTPNAAAEPVAIQDDAVQRFMKKAFEMELHAAATGDQSYGAVDVKDNLMVSATPSHVITKADPTAHAEMEALRDVSAHHHLHADNRIIAISLKADQFQCDATVC